MIKILSITILFTLSACSNTYQNHVEKKIIGQDIIDNGGIFMGSKMSKNGTLYCEYSTKFGNKTFLNKKHNEACAKK
jgi:hypothetical protein